MPLILTFSALTDMPSGFTNIVVHPRYLSELKGLPEDILDYYAAIGEVCVWLETGYQLGIHGIH